MNDAVLNSVNGWLMQEKWRNGVRHSVEQDYIDSYELIVLIKEYWSNFASVYGHIYNVPLFGPMLKTIEENYKVVELIDLPWLYKYILLILISSEIQPYLMDILSKPEVRTGWESIITSLPELIKQSSGREVRIDG